MKRAYYKIRTVCKTELKEGETIEEKVRRIVQNNEPISDGAPIIFTEKKDGVRPEFDIRTDKWLIALNAMDAVNRERIAKSKQYGQGEKQDNNNESGTTEKTKTEKTNTEA